MFKVKIKKHVVIEYLLNGFLHREDGPAVELEGGTKYWYNHGLKHRLNGPAVEWCNGDKEWYKEGIVCFEWEIICSK